MQILHEKLKIIINILDMYAESAHISLFFHII